QFFGTDVSEVAIEKARSGLFDGAIATDVSAERLRRYFTKTEGGGWQVSKTVRDLCIFARQDVTRDPPFSRLDLLSCRNVLIYLGPELQRRVLPAFHYALKPGGFLVLGASETVGTFTNLFSIENKSCKIYSKVHGSPTAHL